MKNEISFNSICDCRNFIKGRSMLTPNQRASFAELRHQIRMSYPPFRGERVRRSTLFSIGLLVGLVLLICSLAG